MFWVKKTSKVLFLGKSNYIFYTSFIFTIIVLSSAYLYNLVTFILYSKIFPVGSVSQSPLPLLVKHFNCSVTFNYFFCMTDIFLLLALLLAVEIFTMVRAIHMRRKVHALGLILYFIIMQLLASVSVFILLLSPHASVAILSMKADTDIRQSLTALNNPNTLQRIGVETSVDKIVDRLTSSRLKNFFIAELNPQKGAVMSYLKISRGEKNTLYNASILPHQLDNNSTKNQKLSSHLLLFSNNTLVISKIDKQTIEHLVPFLADKMVRIEFQKGPKSPTISFLNDKNYNIEQKKQEEILLNKQKEYIAGLESFLTESDTIIQKNQNIIDSYQTDKQREQKAYDDYLAQYGNWYSDCKAQLGNDPICDTGKSKIDENLSILKQNIQTVEDDRKQASENLIAQTQYKQSATFDLAVAKKNYQDAIDNPITPELQDGVFDPPNLIFVRFYDKENKPLSFYLETTLHEYLHFYSSSATNDLDTFLEEGITDYFKLQIASKYLERDTLTLGYPYEVEAIATLLDHMSKNQLITYYFDKNQSDLEKWFDNNYSSSDYQTFLLDGKGITYASPTDEKTKQKYLNDIETILARKKNFSSSSTN